MGLLYYYYRTVNYILDVIFIFDEFGKCYLD